ncbi:DUF2141 domain-containing protein [Croceitalea rosinachiae]|uniref:DUF2141 domain-containing protein n=1 Tax=Croceitalea rosinachiae TaxID=3075596 RepID=A0ABU3A7S2_9FLAO|nr:DUF2141 domain-containing protein [Croceitalea sp. F388]MDT0605984.1 DUF2141 domain-containing protein [Croceitalea sp. F388]
MKIKLLTYFFLFSALCFAQNKITVNIKDVPSSKGKVSVAVYKSDDSFLKFDQVFVSGTAEAIEGTTIVEVKEVPNGEYAIALFYDENGNNELDTNWLGIPKEKVAFSKAKMRAFGPPKYKDCAFKVYEDTAISISL